MDSFIPYKSSKVQPGRTVREKGAESGGSSGRREKREHVLTYAEGPTLRETDSKGV
jgi:hypothetical protein